MNTPRRTNDINPTHTHSSRPRARRTIPFGPASPRASRAAPLRAPRLLAMSTRAPARALAPARAPLAPSRARGIAVRPRAGSNLVRQTGVDEDIPNNPSVVNRSFAIDLGGPTPAVCAMRFPVDSQAIAVACERPLGMFLEQRAEGARSVIFVDEISEGSNAAKAGIRVGDILRLTTAVFEVTAPVDITTWMNPPAKRKVRAYYTTDNKSFDAVMDAIASHSVQIDTPNGKEDVKEIGLVFERRA